jgi:transposase
MERLAARSGAMESRQSGMATAEAVQPGLGLAVDAAGPVAGSGSPEPSPAAPRVRLVDRRQMQFRVVDIERLVDSDDAVRAIWEVTGSVDLSAFYEPIGARQGTAGRTPWDPRLLVAIWIYAYSRGITSAREIERLMVYHPGFQWLAATEEINHHTLSDFRGANREALDRLCVEVLGILRAEDLLTLERVVHDGTKVRACAGVDTFRSGEKLAACLEEARQHVQALAAEENDPELSARCRSARERAARERVERLEHAVSELQVLQQAAGPGREKRTLRVSTTEPEARIMKQSDGGFAPSFNVQLTTETKAGAIAAAEVTTACGDSGQLMPAMDRVEKQLGRLPGQAVADGGFTTRATIEAAAERGIDFFGSMGDGKAQSEGQLRRRGVDPAFFPEAFAYDPQADCYTCPAGQTLHYDGRETDPGVVHYRYRAPQEVCSSCPSRSRCCAGSRPAGRSVVRSVESLLVQQYRAKMETAEAKAVYKQRGALAEFPNAWLKDKLGLRRFRMRGLAKVTMEVLWACLTHNLQLWVRRCWLPAQHAAARA